MTDRMRVDPKFCKMIKTQAAMRGISIKNYTRQLAEKEELSSLPLNNTYKDAVSAYEKKTFKFKIWE